MQPKQPHSLHLWPSLSLHLVCEIEIPLIKLVHSNVAILASTSIPLSIGVGCDRVEGSEMTSDSTNLLFEDLVVESSLKLSLTSCCGSHIHSCLSTAEDYKVFLGCDGCAVQWCVGHVGLHDFEITRVNELHRLGPLFHQIPRELTLAVLSFEAVIKYVRSGAHWRSVINISNSCTWTLSSCSPVCIGQCKLLGICG